MKTGKIFKKIDSRVIQALVMLVVVVFFAYVFYHHYHSFSRYQGSKSSEEKQAVEHPPLQAPEFYNFTPDDDYENIQQYLLFTFDKQKAKNLTSSVQRQESGTGTGSYRILGVVKKDILFLLVRFNSDNKIRLFGKGMAIDDSSRVESITTQQVTILDSQGRETTHKIFQEAYKYIPTAPTKKMQSFPGRAPAQKEKESIEDESPPPPGRDAPPDDEVIEKKNEKKENKDKKTREKQNDGVEKHEK